MKLAAKLFSVTRIFNFVNFILTFSTVLQVVHSDGETLSTVQLDASKAKKPYLYGPDELTKLAKLEKQIYSEITNYEGPEVGVGKVDVDGADLLNRWISDYKATFFKATIPGTIGGFRKSMTAEDIIAGHPLLTFRMMRRYTNEFQQILRHFNDSSSNGFDSFDTKVLCSHSRFSALLTSLAKLEQNLRYKWPTREDMEDSINSILKIQDVYNLKPADIAKGKFSGIETGIELESHHLIEVGQFARKTNQFILGLEWFQFSAEQLSNGENDTRKWHEDIKYEIVKLINKHNANWKSHSFGPGPEQMNYFTRKLSNDTLSLSSSSTKVGTVKELGFKLVKGKRSQNSDLIDYYAVCTGENLQTPEELNELKCFYEKRKSPELLIYPAKVEQLSQDPPVVKIHEAIGPKVAALIKKLSLTTQYVEIYKPKSKASNQLAYFKSRASANSWVPDSMDINLRYLSRRIESITGLNVIGESASDHFEVVAYSCGGNFVLHKDALEDAKTELRGDRISTLLFYLDDVILGGRTAFPRIGTAIQPEAGSVLLWYNLFPDGSVDDRTAHAACPVILGHKWSVNKCITEHGNFLKRKCLLS